ncbi:type 1 glutamine amidotransferase [bacterium]|nr:type 1 glutamine amidotransferase [bacterium]NUP91580.1 type 1 glutamine amidotransferase [Candidatus Omnitrophota bacterium]
MTQPYRFLIIDGYAKSSRCELEDAGCSTASDLFKGLLERYSKGCQVDMAFPSDDDKFSMTDSDISAYQGVVWTGCNLTIYDKEDARVTRQVNLARQVYNVGVPQFGSCWAAQMAVYAAGGTVQPHPKGREMGLARKISLTPEGRSHPMYEGKPTVFEGYISHDDEITHMPAGGLILSGNSYTRVQSVAVRHLNGTFWATQYHPEYDLKEIARLIYCRADRLIKRGFFKDRDAMQAYVDKMVALYQEPDRKDLRWELCIDDDVLSDTIRHCEVINWIHKLVNPTAEGL